MELSLNSFNLLSTNPTIWTAANGILFAFIVGTVLAFTYIATYEGLSYSKSFIHSLVLSPIVTSIAMQAIDGSLARGIGMMGAFSILRFRSNLKDPRDMFFLFASLSLGISCGVQAYTVSITGSLGFCLVIFILSKTPFAQTTQYDGLLRFNILSDKEVQRKINEVLEKNCRRFALVTIRDLSQGSRVDYAYQVKLKAIDKQADLVTDLQQVSSISGLQLLLQQTTVEL